jgi:hypothetical protein
MTVNTALNSQRQTWGQGADYILPIAKQTSYLERRFHWAKLAIYNQHSCPYKPRISILRKKEHTMLNIQTTCDMYN